MVINMPYTGVATGKLLEVVHPKYMIFLMKLLDFVLGLKTFWTRTVDQRCMLVAQSTRCSLALHNPYRSGSKVRFIHHLQDLIRNQRRSFGCHQPQFVVVSYKELSFDVHERHAITTADTLDYFACYLWDHGCQASSDILRT